MKILRAAKCGTGPWPRRTTQDGLRHATTEHGALAEGAYHDIPDVPGRLGLYNDRAKRVLALAQDEAFREFHHDAIGPEHLLLALIRAGTGDREGSGSVGDALNSLGLDLTKARNALGALSGRGDLQPEFGVMPFTPEGHRVIDLAPAEAKLLGAEKVTPKHVLLAVLREPGKAEAMLQSLGLSTEAVRQKVIGSQ